MDDYLERTGLEPGEGVEELVKELDGFPNLKRYFTHFMETDGDTEDRGELPRLIGWIRTQVEDKGIPPAEFFGMDDDDAEDFYTWGHNSRWANVFWSYILVDRNMALGNCLELARRFGDPEIS